MTTKPAAQHQSSLIDSVITVMFISTLFVGLTAVLGAFSAPVDSSPSSPLLEKRQSLPSGTG